MAGRGDLRRKVASLLELPEDMVLDVARISLVGNMELLVENHRGPIFYGPDRVVLAVPQGRLAVEGSELSIGFLSVNQVIILGQIRSVRYLDPEGGSGEC
ncbi:MAG TPA: sporulation protein YqfC [Symbiobacteriaceae bacterium]